MNDANVRKLLDELPRCKVPVSENTLLVFGNYAAVHRVLPMKSEGKSGSREFLAFFIIDQKAPLPVHLDLGPLPERLKRRGELWRRQLQPRGRFCLDTTQGLRHWKWNADLLECCLGVQGGADSGANGEYCMV